MKEKEYTIGGRIFIQKALTPGQWKQIIPLLFQIKLPENLDALSMVFLLGNYIHRALAIVLREKGQKLKDKDLDSLTEFMEEEADALTTLEVVEDFFGCNPMTSISKGLSRLQESLKNLTTGPNGSTNLSSPSPAETSPSETKSSGSIPLENAGPG